MLKIDSLTKNYGSFPALKGLSLEIPDGALHGFVGPNGAGKTTTMRILATLMKPTSGTAFVDGTDVVKDGQKARKLVGYMPDFFGVYDSLKCWEYLDFYARCYRIGAEERKKMTRRLLELVQLEEKEDEYVDALSRGMKQRLCLARSLIHDPKLLILDEPASGMDPRARAEMKGILRTLREMGKTVLISSHILPELAEMCDSLTILDHGELVFSGSVEALNDKMNGNAPLEPNHAESPARLQIRLPPRTSTPMAVLCPESSIRSPSSTRSTLPDDAMKSPVPFALSNPFVPATIVARENVCSVSLTRLRTPALEMAPGQSPL